ncbi:MAG: proton-conducting transporter membrane subunit [Vampirovibrionales bacterium]|nr:proton-conducting transporter membrane subunit [Vampirovibrionales bacterium]
MTPESFFNPFLQFILKQNLHLISPELVVLAVLLLAIVLLAFGKNEAEREQSVWAISFLGTLGAIVTLITLYIQYYAPDAAALGSTLPQSYGNWMNQSVFFGMFEADQFSLFVRGLILLGTLFVISFSRNFIKERSEAQGEFYIILLSATLGSLLLSGARDLIMLFVALETLSVSSYIMVGFFRNTKASTEAALKYLLYGGAATAILLFGFSLFYGLSGSTDFTQIANHLRTADTSYPMLAIASVMVVGGFAFKLSAAPFHMWAPDVYEGAPTPVTAFLSVVSKVAGFAMTMRFLYMLFPNFEELLQTSALVDGRPIGFGLYEAVFAVIALIAILSMVIGNVVALTQNNIKRLLAYSTIGHAGYMLLGLLVLSQSGLSSLLYYLLSYLFTNLGAFAVIIYFNSLTGSDDINAYAGLVKKRPALTLIFTIFLLSLAGMPITAGFFGKFFLFQAVAQAGAWHLWLVVIALLTSTISIYYYLNVVRLMVIAEPSAEVEAMSPEPSQLSFSPVAISLGLCAFATLMIGVLAEPFLQLSADSVRDMGMLQMSPVSEVQQMHEKTKKTTSSVTLIEKVIAKH